jgi:hypothetical protein
MVHLFRCAGVDRRWHGGELLVVVGACAGRARSSVMVLTVPFRGGRAHRIAVEQRTRPRQHGAGDQVV